MCHMNLRFLNDKTIIEFNQFKIIGKIKLIKLCYFMNKYYHNRIVQNIIKYKMIKNK